MITFIICSTLVLTVSFEKSESNEVYAEEPSAASSFTGGTGTSDDPYLISSPGELIKFRNIVNGTNDETKNLFACAKLTQDIIFTGTNNWNKPIAINGSWNDPSTGFQGIFDGDGYAIIGLNQTFDLTIGYDLALFQYLGGSSVIKNLTLRDGKFINPGRDLNIASSPGLTAGSASGFFHTMINTSTASITNCHTIDFNITNLGNSSGATHTASIGINAYSGNSITNCSSSGEILAASGRVGGIMAFVNSTPIQDCYSACDMKITGDGEIGGIVGVAASGQSTLTLQRNHFYGTIEYESGSLVDERGYVGGIAGEVTGTNTQTLTSNYYLASSAYKGKGKNIADVSGQINAISASDFQNTSTFSGWNFSSGNWIMGPKYPLHAWPVHYITLSNNSATTAGTERIFLKEEFGYYLEKTCLDDSQMTSSNGITIPQRTNHSFEGYYTDEDGNGTQIIGPDGKLTSSVDNDSFVKDCTLYAVWTLNHIHDWKYVADDNRIIAVCESDNCYITEGLTLTLNAPTGNMVYDGNARAATIADGYNTEAFVSPAINYYKNGVEVAAEEVKTGGNYIAKVTFANATAQINFEIAKANPTYIAPTGLQATYGDLLSSVVLPDGWTWKNASNTVGNAGNTGNEAIYTPKDKINYNTINVILEIQVAKANPNYLVPTEIEAPYRVKLEQVALPEGFDWMDSSPSLDTWGMHVFKVRFTPEDTQNYNKVENIDINVNVKWVLVDPTQKEVNIIINDGETLFDVNIAIKVEIKTELSVESKQTDYAILAKGFVAKDEDISAIYDVKLIRTTNGIEEEIQPSDIKEGQTIKISMAIPQELQGKEFRLLHIHTSEDVSEIKTSEYSITADGKTLIIETDKLSEFAFVSKTESADNGFVYKDGSFNLWWILAIVLAVIIICLLLFFFFKHKKDKAYASNIYNQEIKEAETKTVEVINSQEEDIAQTKEEK